MHPCVRGPTPALLAEHGEEVGHAYARRRSQDPAFRFQWPRRGGRNLGDVAREALLVMTGGRCAYCDDFPLDTSKVDHFRPKGLAAFYALVCERTNLFIACDGCNQAKREQWDPLLLRPDDDDFVFDRYFWFAPGTGELRPNPGAPPVDQNRARRTIEIFDLNRKTRCGDRILWWKLRRDGVSADLAASAPYRFIGVEH